MKKNDLITLGAVALVFLSHHAIAQYVTNNLQVEASVTNLFDQVLGTDGYWAISTNPVITVRNPTNLTTTIQRTNFLAGASTMSTSTTSDAGEGKSRMVTKFTSYSSSSWKAHIAIESPASGDPSQNYCFVGMGMAENDGDRALVRWQHGSSGSAARPRTYLNGTVKQTWASGISSPGTDLTITYNLDSGYMTFEWDNWASDGTRSNGVDITMSMDVSSLWFNGGTEAGIFFAAQSSVTFSDFWIEEYTPTAPTVPLNLYAWPDSNNVVSVYWDEEALSTDGYNVYRSLEDTGDYTPIATGVMDTHYVDSDVTNGIAYYYKVAGVNAYGEGVQSSYEYAVPTPYFILGTDATQVTKSKYELFDGDTSTLFGLDASGYAGLDYGEGNEKQLVKIRYFLRNDSWGNYDDGRRALIRSAGCMFQGANSEDFGDAVTLFTITTNNTVMGDWNEFTVTNTTPFRYVRYQSGGSFNKINTMAELEFLKASDYTAHGTPIYWLEGFGLTDADDELDSDGDGFDGWEEYVAGTVPTNSASLLKVNSVEVTPNGSVVSWQSVEGKSYTLYGDSTLVALAPVDVVATNIAGLETETSYTNTAGIADSMFYQISVQ